jgi:GT2 family glycosyltransferase
MDDFSPRTLHADMKCRRQDVINLYNILLHRDPESEHIVDTKTGSVFTKTFEEILRSEEFATRIMRMSTPGPQAAVAFRGSGRLDDLVDWALERLPLGAETRERLTDADDWDEVGIALTRDPAVIALVPTLQKPEIRRALRLGYSRREASIHSDAVFVSPDRRCFVSGWIESPAAVPVRQIGIFRGAELLGTSANVARCRRSEAEERFPEAAPRLAGFWAVLELEQAVAPGTRLGISTTGDPERWSLPHAAVGVSAARLRDIALDHLGNAKYCGEPTVEAFFQLDDGGARSLIDLNRGIVAAIVDGGYRMRFGARRPSYEGTVVVCLYGKPEFLMVQAALFSQCPGYDRYEFIYVSNSPELAETLTKDAAIASRIYGVAITLIVLPGNAGFGAANNAAAAAAETDRLLLVNPDVLPRDPQWPRRHAEMVHNLPAEQVRLFGTVLYYDDGSLMHGGMYVDVDGGFSIRGGRMIWRDVLRVEHYGKGAPPETSALRAARPVPAVTGAFMSVDRGWFEKLGGFSADYIYGHYEDVDLCLRSLQAGTPVWLHDLPFWHLESRGSLQSAAHVGGRLVNRWLLTTTWADLAKTALNGPDAARFAASRPREAQAAAGGSAGAVVRRKPAGA